MIRFKTIIAIPIFIVVFWFVAGCADDDTGPCSCTDQSCFEGVVVTVVFDSSSDLDLGEYTIHWTVEDMTGVVEPRDDMGNRLRFYIPHYSSDNSYELTEDHLEITLELYLDNQSTGESDTFELDWQTFVCNICTGSCDDEMATSADVTMTVGPIQSAQ